MYIWSQEYVASPSYLSTRTGMNWKTIRNQHKPPDKDFQGKSEAYNTTPKARRPQVEQDMKKIMKRQINTAQMKE